MLQGPHSRLQMEPDHEQMNGRASYSPLAATIAVKSANRQE